MDYSHPLRYHRAGCRLAYLFLSWVVPTLHQFPMRLSAETIQQDSCSICPSCSRHQWVSCTNRFCSSTKILRGELEKDSLAELSRNLLMMQMHTQQAKMQCCMCVCVVANMKANPCNDAAIFEGLVPY